MIGLKTAKGTKQLKLDPSIYESLQKEKVEVGDVIYIEANSGAVKVGGKKGPIGGKKRKCIKVTFLCLGKPAKPVVRVFTRLSLNHTV